MMNSLVLRFVFLSLIPCVAVAQEITGIGDFAGQLMEPAHVLSGFIGVASLLIGIGCLFAAFLRYTQHRINPIMSPWSTIILLIVIGIVLLFLPFLHKFTGVGLPFALHHL